MDPYSLAKLSSLPIHFQAIHVLNEDDVIRLSQFVYHKNKSSFFRFSITRTICLSNLRFQLPDLIVDKIHLTNGRVLRCERFLPSELFDGF